MKTCLASLLLAIALVAPLHADSPLEKKMETMKRAFKELKVGLQDPAKADKAKLIAAADKLRQAAVDSKNYEPEKTKEIPADKRAEFLAGYKQEMDELIEQIDELKTYLNEGKWAEASEQLTAINQAQRDGHKEYRSEKED